MKLSRKELEIVHQELYTRLEEYQNYHDLDDEPEYLGEVGKLLGRVVEELSV